MAAARDDHAARQHLVADLLHDRFRFPGEERLVDLQAVARSQQPVGDELIAGVQRDEIVETTSPIGISRELAVAHHPRARRVEHREPVEGPLGSPLLHDPDQRIRDEHDTEQRVLQRADDDDDHEHRAEDRVETGEDVRLQDLGERATRAILGCVREPVVDPPTNRGRVEPRRRRLGTHRFGIVDPRNRFGHAGTVLLRPARFVPLTSALRTGR